MTYDKLPKVAIVGRPNVGKSSIYNRFIGKRESIIDPTPGVTRDRHYHLIKSGKHNFLMIDTGGITIDEEDQFAGSIKVQSQIAIAEADLILFLVETGVLTEDDHTIADMLRKSEKNVILVVNKCDNYKLEQSSLEMYSLGLGEPFAVSAIHGVNIGDLLDTVKSKIPAVEVEESPEKR
ncbi:MAG: 50S ribosome-binding GTPase, partial [Spirochaetota bacterium]|nr:50S ribosome-binding GTPase [Spirochaetota bacterium]